MHRFLMVALIVTMGAGDQSSRAFGEDDEVPLARDAEQLSVVSKQWAYPPENDLTITRSIGKHYPLHIVSTRSDDDYAKVRDHYAAKCGHAEPLKGVLVASGAKDGALYLIRQFPPGGQQGVPRTVLIHHSFTHSVTVTVMRAPGEKQTHIDVAIAVR